MSIENLAEGSLVGVKNPDERCLYIGLVKSYDENKLCFDNYLVVSPLGLSVYEKHKERLELDLDGKELYYGGDLVDKLDDDVLVEVASFFGIEPSEEELEKQLKEERSFIRKFEKRFHDTWNKMKNVSKEDVYSTFATLKDLYVISAAGLLPHYTKKWLSRKYGEKYDFMKNEDFASMTSKMLMLLQLETYCVSLALASGVGWIAMIPMIPIGLDLFLEAPEFVRESKELKKRELERKKEELKMKLIKEKLTS